MKMLRILNNNAIVAEDERGREVVLLGAGLGFTKAKGGKVNDSKIEKRFYMDDELTTNKFAELVNSIPMEYIFLSQQIIDEAKLKYGKKLADTIYISLPDHLMTAIANKKNDIAVPNPLLWDVKRFYKDEFEIGEYAIKYIQDKTGVILDIDEAAYIALHFVNAEIGGTKDVAIRITKMMQEIQEIVRKHFNIEFDVDSLNYYRYITHLKFFVQRVLNNTHYDEGDEDLFGMVISKYAKEYECVKEISYFIEQEFQYDVGIDEQTYLTVHIARIIKGNK